jgi:aspartyl-tRNA(Asn)/glutamyl-tRNA(Gln) amidotransferase subunit C
MPKIQKADVEHVARLARLKLTEDEEKKFTEELGEILNYVDELDELKMEKSGTISQITGLENIVRDDVITCKTDREKLLGNVPQQKDGFISVPKIFDSKTETSFPEAKPKDANE